MRDKYATTTVFIVSGKCPTLHLIAFLVVGVLVAVRHVGVPGTVGVFDTPANRAGMAPA